MEIRKIKKVFRSKPTIEGAGVHLKRAFGFREVPLFDPFLMLDDFRSNEPARYIKGFPWHPHRGIETISYVLRGSVEHGDSMGNRGVIGAGDVQWMTAGGGIIHQEMPKGDNEGFMHGFQLWANLPASNKMMPPRYQEINSGDIPEIVTNDGVTLKIICGETAGARGPVRDIVIDPQYVDVSLPAGVEYIHETTPGHTVFIYVTRGRGLFCREKKLFTYEKEFETYTDADASPLLDNGSLALFGDGDSIVALTENDPMRFLLVSGRPLGEPVAWHGPIVMNTYEELEVAFEEYRNGTFIKK